MASYAVVKDMTATKPNEFAPQVVQRLQRPVIRLGDTNIIADILVEFVPITGGINTDIKLIREDRQCTQLI